MSCILVLFSLLPLSSSIINCRISCRRCREKTDHPELMEVYCAMCTECKERRREWLQGAPSLSIRNKEKPVQTDHQESDCIPTICEDPCEEQPVRLTGSPEITTTTTTTTTTSTTTTRTTTTTFKTRRPCLPKPKCIEPMCCALPVLPMCSICDVNKIPITSALNGQTNKIPGSMYLYLGVPKPLLKELKLEKKV